MENLIIETIYINNIKIIKEISTDSEDPYYIEDHYNEDNFHFYHKMTNIITNEFWFKSPYWIKTIDNDPNREVKLIDIDNSNSGIFIKDKCQFKINKKYYNINWGFMINNIE